MVDIKRNVRSVLLLNLIATFLIGCNAPQSEANAEPMICSTTQFLAIDKHVQSGDGMGHGPDIGSGEWKSAIEHKLGLAGHANLPEQDAKQWCRFIQQTLNTSP